MLLLSRTEGLIIFLWWFWWCVVWHEYFFLPLFVITFLGIIFGFNYLKYFEQSDLKRITTHYCFFLSYFLEFFSRSKMASCLSILEWFSFHIKKKSIVFLEAIFFIALLSQHYTPFFGIPRKTVGPCPRWDKESPAHASTASL